MLGSNWEVFMGSGTPPPPFVLGKTVAYYICKAKLLKIGHTLLRSLPHVYITGVNKPWV